jgi:hypothetical protein
MTVRLLAYGGTRSEERARFGAWPDISAGFLEDSYGLAPPLFSFGVGVMANQPFLIIRNRQHLEMRGGYPFTLLLDPGDSSWKHYEWNGARMIADFLASPEGLKVVDSPETATPENIEALFRNNTPITTLSSPEMESFLLGSLRQEKAVVLVPEDLHRTDRPDPTWMARVTARLAPAFRNGAGWLIGGGFAHAEAFGVRLILDDRQETSTESAKACMAAGVEMRRQIEIAQEHSPDGELAKHLSLPFWLWNDAAKVLERLAVLAELLRTTQDPSPELFPENDSGGPFARDIQLARVSAACRLGGAMTRGRANLIFKVLSTGKPALALDLVLALEPFLLEELQRRNWPTAPAASELKLPPELILRTWRSYIASTPKERPALLKAALNELPQITPAEVDALVDCSLENSESLSPWASLRSHSRAGKQVRKRLKEEIRRRLGEHDPLFNAQDYLLFGDDSCMKKLAQAMEALPQAECARIAGEYVNAWLEMLPGYREEVEQSFSQIAKSPFRSFIPVTCKHQIAEAVEETERCGPWSPFQTAFRLFAGEEAKYAGSLPSEEKIFLDAELQEVFSSGGRKAAPRLRELKQLLGEFSQALQTRISAFRLDSDDRREREQWEKELYATGFKEEASYARLQRMLDSPETAPNLDDIPPKMLRQEIDRQFFASALPDSRHHMTALVAVGRKSPQIKSIVLEQLEHVDSQTIDRWVRDRQALDKLLELVPEKKQRVVQILAESDRINSFSGDVLDALGTPMPLTPLVTALVEFLLTSDKKSERLRNNFRRQYWGPDSHKFEKDLRDLLKRSKGS